MRISDWSSDVCSSDLKGPLFRTIARGTKRLSDTPLPQANAFAMVRRRAVAAEIETAIGNHSGSVAKIVKLEHAWRRLDGRNDDGFKVAPFPGRSEEHTSELQSLMRISYAVFCLKKKKTTYIRTQIHY